MRIFVKTISLFFLVIFLHSRAEAFVCPNYEFNTNFVQGANHPDVRVIQEILNSDPRTQIVSSGSGSPGKETNLYGRATRESLKRFQALFIEYIAIADGKFNDKTRLVMNNVCKGPFFQVDKNIVAVETPKEKVPPVVGISGPTHGKSDESFRMYIGASEAIQTPTPDAIIVTGGTIGSIRKTSSTTFSFVVTPNFDVVNKITLQVEADGVEDLSGNKNTDASNEWIVSIEKVAIPIDPGMPTIDIPIPDIPIVTTGTDCSKVASVSVYDYSNPCYGRVPMTGQDYNNNNQSPEEKEKSDNSFLTTMLTGLLTGLSGINALTGGGISKMFSGGGGAVAGTCVCPPTTMPPGTLTGQPTIMLTSLGGTAPPGRYLMTLNPNPVGGKYLGFPIPMPPAFICGQAIAPPPKPGLPPICVNPTGDSTGLPVIGAIPPPPAFMWTGI